MKKRMRIFQLRAVYLVGRVDFFFFFPHVSYMSHGYLAITDHVMANGLINNLPFKHRGVEHACAFDTSEKRDN